jgi:hypothetical protein
MKKFIFIISLMLVGCGAEFVDSDNSSSNSFSVNSSESSSSEGSSSSNCDHQDQVNLVNKMYELNIPDINVPITVDNNLSVQCPDENYTSCNHTSIYKVNDVSITVTQVINCSNSNLTCTKEYPAIPVSCDWVQQLINAKLKYECNITDVFNKFTKNGTEKKQTHISNCDNLISFQFILDSLNNQIDIIEGASTLCGPEKTVILSCIEASGYSNYY